MIKRLFTLLSLIAIAQIAISQSRIKQSINSNWEFHKGAIDGYPANSAKVEWQPISIPHTWNAVDVNDDEPGYYRGIGWYKKILYIPSSDKNKQLYLQFEGANQTAEVYINGKLASKHTGGYTAFNVLISPYLKNTADSLAQNEILVKVDNSFNDAIAPLDADFTFYGGIYRDVYLITANEAHFTLDDNGSQGIKIKTPVVTAETATVTISGNISNLNKAKLTVITDVTDAQGKLVGQVKTAVNSAVFEQSVTIKLPHLWSPDAPYLYRISSKIFVGDKLLDEVNNPLGLRWYSFDADKGFYLNGKPVKLIGACRHQDFNGLGNALPNALHERDIELLKNMGGNFIRIAHYPQDPAILEACDRLGILASVEIPIVNRITETEAFYANCKQMQLEMIRQNYNHPSVVIWAYMNEVLLRPKYTRNSDEQKRYFARITALAKSLDSLTRSEDKERYTMISCHGSFDLYQSTGLTAVPQIIGWNLYNGWYSAGFEGFARFLDNHHKNLPHTPMIVTEYGADADIRVHSTKPERFDKSIEYQVQYHQYYLKTMIEKPFVVGGALWNLADFNSESRADATPHINTKGINTDDRMPKDAYYFYQANLLKKPFLKIGSTGWNLRTGIADANGVCTQQVYTYSNGHDVQLWLNGKLLKSQPVEQGVAVFDVPFVDGDNSIKAVGTLNGKVYEDMATVKFKMVPATFTNTADHFTDMNISLGDNRFFVDEKLQQVWMPEQPYQKGSWGYIGGKVFVMPDHSRQSFGSDKSIYDTDLDAVYETQRTGIEAFKFDVPDGEYDITLGFAELEGKPAGPALVYNLGGTEQAATTAQRAFDVSINGELVIKSLGTQNYLQAQRAYATTIRVSAKNNAGISIDFKALKGAAILNAVQIAKVY